MDASNNWQDHAPAAAQTGTVGDYGIFEPEHGYDLGADYYDLWKWQKIWQTVEWPHIDRMLSALEAKSGGLSSVLDIGAGTGSYLRHAADKFRTTKFYGVDVSRRMLSLAQSKLKGRAILTPGDARNLPFPDAHFDSVLMCRVGSHLNEIDATATEIRRVLRCGGLLILTDVDPRHPYQHTRIPYETTKITIATFKHSLDEWASIAVKLGFRLRCQHTIWSGDVHQSGVTILPSSLASSRSHPMSFIMGAQKYTC